MVKFYQKFCLRLTILHEIYVSLFILIDCVRIGACVRSSISQTSIVPSFFAIKKTPGLVGDHSASLIRLENALVCKSGPVLK
jgi:hypothetical protein